MDNEAIRTLDADEINEISGALTMLQWVEKYRAWKEFPGCHDASSIRIAEIAGLQGTCVDSSW